MTGDHRNVTIYITRGENMEVIASSSEPVTLSLYTESDAGIRENKESSRYRVSGTSFTATVSISRRACARLSRRFGLKRSKTRGGKHKLRSGAPYWRRASFGFFGIPKSVGQPQTKFNRNVRPKGTHSHFRFYR